MSYNWRISQLRIRLIIVLLLAISVGNDYDHQMMEFYNILEEIA